MSQPHAAVDELGLSSAYRPRAKRASPLGEPQRRVDVCDSGGDDSAREASQRAGAVQCLLEYGAVVGAVDAYDVECCMDVLV